jgi:hypothetical protein
MKQKDILKIAKESIQDNRKVLNALGDERRVTIHHPEEDIIELIKELMPKSTAGKVAVAGLVALVAWYLLKNK